MGNKRQFFTPFTRQSQVLIILRQRVFENSAFFFPQYFLPFQRQVPPAEIRLLSPSVFYLDQTKTLSFGTVFRSDNPFCKYFWILPSIMRYSYKGAVLCERRAIVISINPCQPAQYVRAHLG